MNQETESLIEVIENDEYLYLTVQSCLSVAECSNDPHGSMEKWLKEWVTDTLFAGENQIAIYVRLVLIPKIDFSAMAAYFLDDEFTEN